MTDSHLNLPIIRLSNKLLEDDFYPFKKLNKMPFAMIAHILYKKIDELQCATHSNLVIKFIKNELGFKGILFSDDLCMKALKGSYKNRARKAMLAGCDILLHCDSNLSNILKSCDGAGFSSKELINKIDLINEAFS